MILKSNFMFEENTIKIDWRTISEHFEKNDHTRNKSKRNKI